MLHIGLDIGVCCAYALSMIPLLIKFTKNQVKAIRALAKSTGMSVSEHVRRALDQYLERFK